MYIRSKYINSLYKINKDLKKLCIHNNLRNKRLGLFKSENPIAISLLILYKNDFDL
jgi:hypothetical protein